jgi:hypothetical protein
MGNATVHGRRSNAARGRVGMGLFDFSRFFLAPDSERIPNGSSWNLGCGDRLNLSGRHWEEARSRANRFVVAPGHVVTEFEAVVKEYPHFWLVEKRGKAGDEAEALA